MYENRHSEEVNGKEELRSSSTRQENTAVDNHGKTTIDHAFKKMGPNEANEEKNGLELKKKFEEKEFNELIRKRSDFERGQRECQENLRRSIVCHFNDDKYKEEKNTYQNRMKLHHTREDSRRRQKSPVKGRESGKAQRIGDNYEDKIKSTKSKTERHREYYGRREKDKVRDYYERTKRHPDKLEKARENEEKNENNKRKRTVNKSIIPNSEDKGKKRKKH